MSATPFTYPIEHDPPSLVKEGDIELDFISKLVRMKYTYREDIRDRKKLEANFREKFDRLNAVTLSDSEFTRLLDQITTPDVYKAAETLRTRNHFERDDGTPLNFTLVNIKDWCKNDFEVVNQLRINTRSSYQRYDVMLLTNTYYFVNNNTNTLVQRLLSTDYADKVIVTTIQKLGLALDENSKRNRTRKKFNRATYKEQLAPLDLGWKDRSTREHALMADLVPLLKQRALGRDISGLSGYGNPNL